MKVTYLANAACLYSRDNFTILSDPWLSDTAFLGSWFHFPPLLTRIEDLQFDLLYLSHIHNDHADDSTLAKISKSTPIICLDDEGPNYLQKKLQSVGFKEIYAMKDQEEANFGSFVISMYKPFAGHLFHPTEIGNPLDSGIVMTSGGYKVANLNDNAPTPEAAQMLLKNHGSIDLLQAVDSCAGPYPACFKNLGTEEKFKERERILGRHMNLMIKCAKIMEAKLMQPFAGHYALGGRLQASHQKFLAVQEPKVIADMIEAAGLRPLLLEEMDSYDLASKKIEYSGFQKPSWDEWRSKSRYAPYAYDIMSTSGQGELHGKMDQALGRLMKKQDSLKCYPAWSVELHTNCNPFRFSMNPKGTSQKVIKFFLPNQLMNAILDRKIHWNDAEIGCHIEMHREPNEHSPDVHLLMSYFHV